MHGGKTKKYNKTKSKETKQEGIGQSKKQDNTTKNETKREIMGHIENEGEKP